MKLNPFSFILIAILLGILISDWRKGLKAYFKHVFFLALCVSTFTNLGFFIGIGELTVGYENAITLFLFCIGLLYFLLGGAADRKLLILGVLLCGSAMLGIVSLSVAPYGGGILRDLSEWDGYVMGSVSLDYRPSFAGVNPVMYLNLLKYPFLLAIAYRVFGREDFLWMRDSLLFAANFMIAYGFLELVLKKIFRLNLTELFLNPFFGKESATLSGFERMQGFYKEASHYSAALFLVCVMSILRIRGLSDLSKRSLEHIRMILLLVLLAFSTSFSSIVYFIALGVLYLTVCVGIRPQILLYTGSALLIVAVVIVSSESLMRFLHLDSLYLRFQNLFQSVELLLSGKNATISSEGARFASIFSMLKILSRRPLLGVGLGVTDAHSVLFSILGNLGVVGFSLWAAILLRFGRFRKGCGVFLFVMILGLSFAGGLGSFAKPEYPVLFAVAGQTLCAKAQEKERVKAYEVEASKA